jgi:hypothetical protein
MMTDFSPRFLTYTSANADQSATWLAYIKTPDVKGYWPIHFKGSTEGDALDAAKEFYEATRARREAGIKARQENAEKARAARKKKEQAA